MALAKTRRPSALAHAGAACALLWSKTPMNRLVQQVRARRNEALHLKVYTRKPAAVVIRVPHTRVGITLPALT